MDFCVLGCPGINSSLTATNWPGMTIFNWVPLNWGDRSEGNKWSLLSRSLYLPPLGHCNAGSNRVAVNPACCWPTRKLVKGSGWGGTVGVGGGKALSLGMKNMGGGDILRCSDFWGEDVVLLGIRRSDVKRKAASVVTKSWRGGSRPAWVWILALLLTNCVALDKLLHL